QRVGMIGALVLAFAVLVSTARWRLRQDNRQTVVAVVCSAILGIGLAVMALWPTIFPALAVTPLVSVGIALPYADKRVLKPLIAAAWLSVVVAALTGAWLLMRLPNEPHPALDAAFVTTTLAAATALLLLELWQFRTRLMATLAQARLAEERLGYEATHDALTDLPNRALITDRLALAMERARSDAGRPFALLFLDLDRFKHVNDSLGHTLGDELLKAVARRLSSCIRTGDTIGRMGGDEFVMLLEGASPEDAERLAERIQEVLSSPFRLHGHELYATTSIGVVVSPEGYEEPEELLRDADTAMYRAKDKGKARHVVFDARMRQKAISLLRLETDLRRAVEQEEFVVYYQPIVWLASGGVSGFEALVRWAHPERGLLSPDAFMKLAEETGIIHDIDRFVLSEACRQTAFWRENFRDPYPPTVNVNLSPLGLARPGLPGEISNVLAKTGLPGHALVIELTESAVMEDAETATKTLGNLRELGVRVHIDDFGTGYSSLSLLHRLPVDALKVDRSFVSGICEEGENAEISRTILTMAHELGMDVVAEGVETTEQLDTLREMGCDYVQGYRFSRPVYARRAQAILAAEPVW
ncbi:MAG: putative bifunctional diguanylate cyclase/phosphodiesterase, partial [Rubrobacteraceae bacterium]